MKEYQYLLFDLDGTLTDSMEGITKCVAYALEHFDIYVKDLTELYPFIGPPLKESFREFYHFSDEQIEVATKKYHERFAEKGMFENRLYDGISELLEKLNGKGCYTLMLATSKPEVFAKQILAYFGIDKQFAFAGGSELGGLRTHKAEVIQYVLESNHITDLEKVVMIGDRKHDILGARETGIDSIGVLYGYGDRKELTEAGATYIVESVEKLGKLLRIGQ